MGAIIPNSAKWKYYSKIQTGVNRKQHNRKTKRRTEKEKPVSILGGKIATYLWKQDFLPESEVFNPQRYTPLCPSLQHMGLCGCFPFLRGTVSINPYSY